MALATNLDGFYRLSQVIGDKKSDPPVEGKYPVSKTSWYAGIKARIYPSPVKLGGGRSSGWRKRDIHDLCNGKTQW